MLSGDREECSMALKKNELTSQNENENSLSEKKAKSVFNAREKKILTTFSIEPSFKFELEELFSEMGLSWAGGIRFALKEFYKKNSD
jgi:hypothetical protein